MTTHFSYDKEGDTSRVIRDAMLSHLNTAVVVVSDIDAPDEVRIEGQKYPVYYSEGYKGGVNYNSIMIAQGSEGLDDSLYPLMKPSEARTKR